MVGLSYLLRTDNIQRVAGRMDLNDTIRLVMYPAVIRNLFGEHVLPINDEEMMKRLKDEFVLYDDQFEYGTQIPQLFLRSFQFLYLYFYIIVFIL